MRGRHRHAKLGESKDRKHGANVHAPPAARSVMTERGRGRERERERDGGEAGKLNQYLYICTSKASKLSSCCVSIRTFVVVRPVN